MTGIRSFALAACCFGLTAATVPAARAASYDQLCQTLKIHRVRSAVEARGAVTPEGSAIEMKGEIKGVMMAGDSRTYLFKLDDTLLTLAAAPQLTDDGTLRQGATVRVLARVGGAEATWEILAATQQPEASVLLKLPEPPTAAADDSALIVVPPMTSMILPKNNAPDPVAPARPAPRTAPRPTTSNAPPPVLDINAIKPFYKDVVRRHNRRLSEAQVDEIATALVSAGYDNGINPRFLTAIIAVESDFDINCRSGSGAMGLGQLMPFNVPEAGITDPWNPTQNVIGTARLLRGHLNDYRGRSDGTLLAVAAYNAGPGAVRRAGYRVPSGSQVQRYVWKVYYKYKELAPELFGK